MTWTTWWRWDRGVLAIMLTFLLCLPLLTPRIYAVDSVEYYAYLRSWVFDRDVDFTNEYTYFHQANPRSGIAEALLNQTDPVTRRPINVAPIGTAVLWTPAFLLAHGGVLLARSVGIELVADGYSWPYRWSVVVATLLYGLAAMLLIYRLARGYSGAWTAGVATLVTWLASPVLFFMYVSPPWSHVPSLFVTTLFLVFWLHTLERRSVLQWAILGLLGGLMTLCREQLGLFMLLPALEGLETYGKLLRSHRWAACYRLAGQHLLFLLTVGCMLIPQFLVYRSLNGRWGPSRHVSGKLDWASPHFFDTLFDPAHGAFMWTPVWLLGILGLPLLWARDRRLVLYLGAVFLAQVYINGAFNPTWHLTGSFGFRRLIEATPIFVLGLALLLDRLRLPPWLTLVFCAALIVWNVGLIAQWALPPRPIREGLIWEGMLERQVGVIQSAVERLPTLLFERCKFVENGRC